MNPAITPEALAAALAEATDEELFAEVQRRRAGKRKTYSGGVVWAKHNPDYVGCRCAKCIKARAKRDATGSNAPPCGSLKPASTAV